MHADRNGRDGNPVTAPARVKNNLALSARIVRRSLRRGRQKFRFRRISLAGIPIFFANSFPKSGTHLLTQVLQGFSSIGPAVVSGLPAIVTYEGDTGRERSPGEILSDLQRLLPGDIAYGHVQAISAAQEFFLENRSAVYFIVRDPRDVVVSHVHYVTEMEPNHIHHQYYKDELSNFNERLAASILGRENIDFPFPNIFHRFEPYMEWIGHPKVILLRYEDFITQPSSILNVILDHAVVNGFPVGKDRTHAIQVLQDSIDPQRSPTFRSGKIGGWRAEFSEENIQLFKQVAGDLLIHLGYERDDSW